jgi:thiol-disulfide isomerase/thioredoxin
VNKAKLTLAATLLLILFAAPDVVAEPNTTGTPPASKPVLVVLIFDEGCKTWCQKVRPMMGELKEMFGNQIEVAELDATQDKLKDAEAKAKSLGIAAFLRDSAEWVPIVGVFNPQRKLVKELVGPKGKDTYVSAVKKALAARN